MANSTLTCLQQSIQILKAYFLQVFRRLWYILDKALITFYPVLSCVSKSHCLFGDGAAFGPESHPDLCESLSWSRQWSTEKPAEIWWLTQSLGIISSYTGPDGKHSISQYLKVSCFSPASMEGFLSQKERIKDWISTSKSWRQGSDLSSKFPFCGFLHGYIFNFWCTLRKTDSNTFNTRVMLYSLKAKWKITFSFSVFDFGTLIIKYSEQTF